MKYMRISNVVFSGLMTFFLTASLVAYTPTPLQAAVTSTDIDAQSTVVKSQLMGSLSEYVKLLQLIVINKLEQKVRELRITRGLPV